MTPRTFDAILEDMKAYAEKICALYFAHGGHGNFADFSVAVAINVTTGERGHPITDTTSIDKLGIVIPEALTGNLIALVDEALDRFADTKVLTPGIGRADGRETGYVLMFSFVKLRDHLVEIELKTNFAHCEAISGNEAGISLASTLERALEGLSIELGEHPILFHLEGQTGYARHMPGLLIPASSANAAIQKFRWLFFPDRMLALGASGDLPLPDDVIGKVRALPVADDAHDEMVA